MKLPLILILALSVGCSSPTVIVRSFPVLSEEENLALDAQFEAGKSAFAKAEDAAEAIKQADAKEARETEWARVKVLASQAEKKALEDARLQKIARAKAAAAWKARGGVKIGMTKSQSLASQWGRPQSVNKTTTRNGTHEQWCYNGGYLYFDNGILTTIQN